jgi:hypothetical protein
MFPSLQRSANMLPHQFMWWTRTIINHLKATTGSSLKEPAVLLGERKSPIILRYCREIIFTADNLDNAQKEALAMEIATTATELVNYMEACSLATGRSPLGVIAAAINVAFHIHTREKEFLALAEVSQISARVGAGRSTVASSGRELIDQLNIAAKSAGLRPVEKNSLHTYWRDSILPLVIQANEDLARSYLEVPAVKKPAVIGVTRQTAAHQSSGPSLPKLPARRTAGKPASSKPKQAIPASAQPSPVSISSTARPRPKAFDKSRTLRQARLVKISEALIRLLDCPCATNVQKQKFQQQLGEARRLQGEVEVSAIAARSSAHGDNPTPPKPILSEEDLLMEELLIAGVSPDIMCDAPRLQALRAVTPHKDDIYRALLKLEEPDPMGDRMSTRTGFLIGSDPDFFIRHTQQQDMTETISEAAGAEPLRKRRKTHEAASEAATTDQSEVSDMENEPRHPLTTDSIPKYQTRI